MTTLKLEKIAKKYCSVNHNEDNYGIGGGLDSCKFASRRHEDAKEDAGKLTEGQATQLFKKATDLDLDFVKAVINYAVPNMEWHHAGKLPKSYGGGMKKTYFLNAKEICDLATNWENYCGKYHISLENEKTAAQAKKQIEAKKEAFLIENAVKKVRISTYPKNFYRLYSECDGKFGWFGADKNKYGMDEYHTGWEFSSEVKYHEFLNIAG